MFTLQVELSTIYKIFDNEETDLKSILNLSFMIKSTDCLKRMKRSKGI